MYFFEINSKTNSYFQLKLNEAIHSTASTDSMNARKLVKCFSTSITPQLQSLIGDL